jgi:hypothetical protein
MRGFQKLSIDVPPHLHLSHVSYVSLVWLTRHPPVCTPYDISIARCQGSTNWNHNLVHVRHQDGTPKTLALSTREFSLAPSTSLMHPSSMWRFGMKKSRPMSDGSRVNWCRMIFKMTWVPLSFWLMRNRTLAGIENFTNHYSLCRHRLTNLSCIYMEMRSNLANVAF